MAIIVAIAIGIGFMFFPAISDDIGYMTPFRNFLEGKEQNLWDTIWDNISNRYNHDNARLSNVIMILTAWWPRWIPSLISTFAVWSILWLGGLIGQITNHNASFALWCFLFTVFFPWIDQLYLIVFQINYLWTTALSLWLIYIWLKPQKNFLSIILCFLIGFMHNAFASGLLCSLIGLMIFYRRFRSIRYVIDTLAFLPGIIYITTAPSGKYAWLYFADRQYIIYVFLIPIILFLVALTITQIRRRSFYTDERLFLLSASSITFAVFMVLFPMGPRTGSLGIVTACIGLCSLTRYSMKNVIITTATFALAITHIVYVDIESYKSMTMTAEAISSYNAAPDDTHFVDMTLRENAPWICFQKPYFGWFSHNSTTRMFDKLYGIKNKPFKIAPKELKDINFQKLISIPGDAGIYEYERLLIGSPISDRPSVVKLKISTSSTSYCADYYHLPISSNPKLAWFYPEHSTASQLFKMNYTNISYQR